MKMFSIFFILISRGAKIRIKNTIVLYRYTYFQEIYRVSIYFLNIFILKINTLRIPHELILKKSCSETS
jgi:hypothetical protein